MRQINTPTTAEEEALYKAGYRLVAGVDEAGRGALVGPVVAAAVIMPRDIDTSWRAQVKDSKQLTPARRETLFGLIHQTALAVGVGTAPPDIIDERGIVRATRLAMKAAIERLAPAPQFVLIDYLRLPEVNLPQKGIKFGDSLCFSIACASIIAKVTRDSIMAELDGRYPGYGLAGHKGYGTGMHLACLRRHGPCPAHRRSFRPVREAAESFIGNLQL